MPLEIRSRAQRRAAEAPSDLAPATLLAPSDLKRCQALLQQASTAKVTEEISRIAAATLQRRLGLERFMVVRVDQDEGYCSTLQVLEIGLTHDWHLLSWRLRGRALRNDGSLGQRDAAAWFSRATIWRRMLDGEWRVLRPIGNTRREPAPR